MTRARRYRFVVRIDKDLARAAMAGLLLAAAPLELGSEERTMPTSHYLAPSGIYSRIVTTGSGDKDTLLGLTQDHVLIAGDNPTGDGRLGIGTNAVNADHRMEVAGGGVKVEGHGQFGGLWFGQYPYNAGDPAYGYHGDSGTGHVTARINTSAATAGVNRHAFFANTTTGRTLFSAGPNSSAAGGQGVTVYTNYNGSPSLSQNTALSFSGFLELCELEAITMTQLLSGVTAACSGGRIAVMATDFTTDPPGIKGTSQLLCCRLGEYELSGSLSETKILP